MEEIVLTFFNHVYIPHVLALNLIGWGLKCLFNHKGWRQWSDIIPVLLGICGIFMAWASPVLIREHEGGFILYGLANASVAWILHQIFKAVPGGKTETMKENITQTFRTLTGTGKTLKGTGDGTKEERSPKKR